MLLDPGLLQTFLTERIINALDLKPVDSVNMGISEFLVKKEGEMSSKECERTKDDILWTTNLQIYLMCWVFRRYAQIFKTKI